MERIHRAVKGRNPKRREVSTERINFRATPKLKNHLAYLVNLQNEGFKNKCSQSDIIESALLAYEAILIKKIEEHEAHINESVSDAMNAFKKRFPNL